MSFVTTPIVRGIKEIQYLYDICYKQNLGFICGSYARYCCSQRYDVVLPSDVDIFPKSENSFNELKLLLGEPDYESKNAISYNRQFDDDRLRFSPKIQIVKYIHSFDNIEAILNIFDFSVARCGILSETECLVSSYFHEDENHRRLRMEYIKCPLSQIRRLTKYQQLKYKLSIKEFLKVLIRWEDYEHKDQLIRLLNQENFQESDLEELHKLIYID